MGGKGEALLKFGIPIIFGTESIAGFDFFLLEERREVFVFVCLGILGFFYPIIQLKTKTPNSNRGAPKARRAEMAVEIVEKHKDKDRKNERRKREQKY